MKAPGLMVVAIIVLALAVSITPGTSYSQQQETAWAGDHDFPGNNWALYFLKRIRCNPNCGNLETYTLWGGQNISVGTVFVVNQPLGNDIFVQMETTGGWVMTEVHIAYGDELEDIPMNGGGNPIPGQFPINDSFDPGVTIVTYRITIPDGYCGFDGYIATHAVVELMQDGPASDGESLVVRTLPGSYSLAEPYPNPFNASSVISVTLPEAAPLTVNVYSVTGQLVATLTDGMISAGTREFHFDASNVASGVYFVRATVPGHLDEMRKLMLVK